MHSQGSRDKATSLNTIWLIRKDEENLAALVMTATKTKIHWQKNSSKRPHITASNV